MRCTPDNINLVCDIVLQQMNDDNGRGEFDDESDLLNAFEIVIGWLEDDSDYVEDDDGNIVEKS
jgi:hypothetical protein